MVINISVPAIMHQYSPLLCSHVKHSHIMHSHVMQSCYALPLQDQPGCIPGCGGLYYCRAIFEIFILGLPAIMHLYCPMLCNHMWCSACYMGNLFLVVILCTAHYHAFILPNVMHYLLFQLLSLPACLLCTQKKLWHISAWRLEAILNTIKMIFIGLETRLIFNRV